MPTRPPQHRPPHAKPRDQVRREYDQQRAPAHAQAYDHAWRKLRKAHLSMFPLCKMCFEADGGRVVAAEVVDHIVPIWADPSRRLDPTNLQSLCVRHNTIKGYNDRAAGALSPNKYRNG